MWLLEELKTMFFYSKISKGGSAHSFGIHVAKMAGGSQIVILKSKVTQN
jgi:DNA mismatch repair protein MutS